MLDNLGGFALLQLLSALNALPSDSQCPCTHGDYTLKLNIQILIFFFKLNFRYSKFMSQSVFFYGFNEKYMYFYYFSHADNGYLLKTSLRGENTDENNDSHLPKQYID